jgi:hypothetical protein
MISGKKTAEKTHRRGPMTADAVSVILFAGYIAFVLNSLAVRQVIGEMDRLLTKFVF